jgi:hypothetical protein
MESPDKALTRLFVMASTVEARVGIVLVPFAEVDPGEVFLDWPFAVSETCWSHPFRICFYPNEVSGIFRKIR